MRALVRRVERAEGVQAPVTDSEAQAASTVGRKRSGGGFSRPVNEAADREKLSCQSVYETLWFVSQWTTAPRGSSRASGNGALGRPANKQVSNYGPAKSFSVAEISGTVLV